MTILMKMARKATIIPPKANKYFNLILPMNIRIIQTKKSIMAVERLAGIIKAHTTSTGTRAGKKDSL
jgi:hypothetical protein